MIKSSNITNISLNMLSEKDKPHSESLIGKQPVINHQEREIEENSDEDNEEIQPRKAG